mgnify:FL=1
MARTESNPFALLKKLEQRGRDHQAVLPAQEEVSPEWSGIGFRLGAWRLVAPMDQVNEILTMPRLSPVPNTKPWVKGIANVRGTLLPIMDLGGFLGRASTMTRLSRVVVVRHGELTAGLLVDEVLGMRRFLEDDRVPVPETVDEALRPYLVSCFSADDGVWYVFGMRALAESPQFLKVAS